MIRSVVLVPLDPVPPKFNSFFFVELSSNGKSCDCVKVSVEILLIRVLSVVGFKDFDHLCAIGFYLSQLAVGDEEGVRGLLHLVLLSCN